jgi:hypothetical protein
VAWTEADRVALRDAMGASALYSYQYPRLENAINSVQSIADGGSCPDNSTETAIRSYLADLTTIRSRIKAMWGQVQVGDAKGISLDAVRGIAALKMEGRRIIHQIAAALSIRPLRDVFAPAPLDSGEGDPPDVYG